MSARDFLRPLHAFAQEQTPDPNAAPADAESLKFGDLATMAQDFVQGIVTLDPQTAILRAGLTFLVVIAAMIVLWLVRLLFKALASKLTTGEDGDARKRTKLGGATQAIARIAIWLGAIFVALSIWGLDYGTLLDGPLGVFLAGLARAAIIAIIIIAAIEATEFAISHLLNRVAAHANEPRRAAQLRTLSPVLTGLARTVIIVVGAMMLLSEIGVEIGPLIASAGVVGLAIGFGAQGLVKDFLTGMFLIMEDSVSIGDIVNVGGTGGLVEEMTLRTLKLRQFDGTLSVFPYSEAQVIHNLTKNFSCYVFDLGISYGSDINKALEVMKTVGEEMQNDDEFRDLISQPLEIYGVDAWADSAVILKARFRTKPMQQWTVGRAYLKRVKEAFDAAGIEIPFPHMKLVSPDDAIPTKAIST